MFRSFLNLNALPVPLLRQVSSLRAFGPGGGQIWGVVRVSARAPFGVLGGK